LVSERLIKRIEGARKLSWKYHSKRITFYLPGMFYLDGKTGLYPAVSVTGRQCALQCKHCRGKLLETMVPAKSSEQLISLARQWKKDGIIGILLSGGSNLDGVVPLEPIIPAIPKLKKMGFFVSAHTGFVTPGLAGSLKEAGIDQILLDVVGDDLVIKDVLNLDGGTSLISSALDAAFSANLQVVPHIIVGLGGEISGEYNALEMLRDYPVKILSYVVLMPAVALGDAIPPISLEDVLDVIVTGREVFPDIIQTLGCARPRGKYRLELERSAIRAGINRMALWSDDAINEAKKLGLDIEFRKTCCSVPPDIIKE